LQTVRQVQFVVVLLYYGCYVFVLLAFMYYRAHHCNLYCVLPWGNVLVVGPDREVHPIRLAIRLRMRHHGVYYVLRAANGDALEIERVTK
jgi:hypothetical protein